MLWLFKISKIEAKIAKIVHCGYSVAAQILSKTSDGHNCPQIIHQFHQVLGCNNNIPNEIPEQNTKNFIIRRSSITPHTLIIIARWDLGHSSNFSGYLVP